MTERRMLNLVVRITAMQPEDAGFSGAMTVIRTSKDITFTIDDRLVSGLLARTGCATMPCGRALDVRGFFSAPGLFVVRSIALARTPGLRLAASNPEQTRTLVVGIRSMFPNTRSFGGTMVVQRSGKVIDFTAGDRIVSDFLAREGLATVPSDLLIDVSGVFSTPDLFIVRSMTLSASVSLVDLAA